MRTEAPKNFQVSTSFFDLEYDHFYPDEAPSTGHKKLSHDNVRSIVAEFMNLGYDDVPDLMMQVALKELRLDDPDSYWAEKGKGYNGDEMWITFDLPDRVWDRLSNYTVKLPDHRIDDYGILPYVRGKGVDTTDLSPVEAIKTQLLAENNGKKVPAIEAATAATVERIKFDQVTIGQTKHYDAVEPRKPVVPKDSPKDTPKIWGVVVRDDRTGSYRLMDGYHRMKSRTDYNKTGLFIILR